MHGLKWIEVPAGLALEKIAEQLTLHELGNQKRDRHAAVDDFILRVILDDDRAMPQLVQFFGVKHRRLVALVAVWEKELGGTLDAGAEFAHQVDLAFPTRAEMSDDLVMIAQHFAGRKIKGVDAQTGGSNPGHAALRRPLAGARRGTPAIPEARAQVFGRGNDIFNAHRPSIAILFERRQPCSRPRLRATGM